MEIGLFFGSFNPIHNGHLLIADYIIKNTPLKQVWFVVSPQNPFKKAESLLDYNERIKMVKMAIKGRVPFKVSEVEALLPVPSYTINTLDYLKKKHLEHQFALIVGSDSMASFDKWKDYKRILSEYPIYVYKRGEEKGKLKSKNIICLDSPLIDISSTKIRGLIELDKPIKDYLPKPVYKHITSKKLYI